MKIIGMDYIEKMIELALWSSYIKGEREISVILVAKPASGKTTALMKYANNKGLCVLSDSTAYGIRRDIIPLVRLGKIKHIVIPDLLKPLNRGQSAVADFISLMNSLVEEGVGSISTYNEKYDESVKLVRCGLITSVTPEFIKDSRTRWSKMGFISRCIIMSYSYSKETINKILEFHLTEQSLKEDNVKLELPDKKIDVRAEEKYNRMILPDVKMIADAHNSHGFRELRHHITLMKANALSNGRGYVNEEDVNLVKKLLLWVNFDLKVL